MGGEATLRYGFETSVAGLTAECDGGEAGSIGTGGGATPIGSRACYRGTLTGRYMEEEQPGRRFYELVPSEQRDHVVTPGDTIWCERDFVFIEGWAGPPAGRE